MMSAIAVIKKVNYKNYFACFSLFILSLNLSSQTFTPSNLTGLKLWYKINESASVNRDSIFQLIDFSGNNNHATQSVLANQPKLIPNALNGLPVMRMDGIDDFMSFPFLNDIMDCFFVLKHNTGNQDYATILGNLTSYEFIGGTDSILFSSSFVSSNLNNGTININQINYNANTAKKPKEYSLISLQPIGNLNAGNIGNDRLCWEILGWGFCRNLLFLIGL